MKNIIDKLTKVLADVQQAIERLDINSDEARLKTLESEMSKGDFWQDQAKAEQVSQEAVGLKKSIKAWRELEADLTSLLELAKISTDESIEEFHQQADSLIARADKLLIDLKLAGPYDKSTAILQLSAGVGGTDAQDWAQMLLTMYSKFSSDNDLVAELVDVSYGEEAGIKSATLEIAGKFAYGKLKGEKGVHRLVRLSPFNADNLRQTSFALVDVIPEIPPAEVKIDEKDLRIDTFRAGGHGGQSVNTTDSAVRITHLPTGITVSIQNERSQLKNKQKALSILASRLSEFARQQNLDDISQIRGQLKSADWGSQIRSYVMQPYTKVKDHRTGYETSDVNAVLAGKLEPFIEAYLNKNIS